MNELFNPYQQQAVISVLSAFEKSLRESQRWLNGVHEDGILYRKTLELSTEQRSAAREQIALALQEVRSLADRLGFEPQLENVGDELRAQMSLHWADLSSRHAASLRGFGEVNPALADVIDRPLEQFEQIAMKLSWLFAQ